MISSTSVARGREAFARRRWVDAFSNLSAAEQESPLDPVDYEQLGITELSTDAAGVDTWERAGSPAAGGYWRTPNWSVPRAATTIWSRSIFQIATPSHLALEVLQTSSQVSFNVAGNPAIVCNRAQ